MRSSTILPFTAAAALSLAVLSLPAMAATAHNSQVGGAFGSTKNTCGATAYFPAGTGCLSSYIEGRDDGGVLPPPNEDRARYRQRPPLQ